MSKDSVMVDCVMTILSYCKETTSSKMMCKLKNGSEFADTLVLDTFLNMYLLTTDKHNKPLETLKYLYDLSLNPDHKKSPELGNILEHFGLLDNNSAMSEHVRNVVQSSIYFDHEGMINIDSPILEMLGDSQLSNL